MREATLAGRVRLLAPVRPPKAGVVTPDGKGQRACARGVQGAVLEGQVVAQLERALADQRIAAVSVGGGQGPRAAAHLRHAAPSGDHAAIGLVAVVVAGDEVGRRQLNVSGPLQRSDGQVGREHGIGDEFQVVIRVRPVVIDAEAEAAAPLIVTDGNLVRSGGEHDRAALLRNIALALEIIVADDGLSVDVDHAAVVAVQREGVPAGRLDIDGAGEEGLEIIVVLQVCEAAAPAVDVHAQDVSALRVALGDGRRRQARPNGSARWEGC